MSNLKLNASGALGLSLMTMSLIVPSVSTTLRVTVLPPSAALA